MVEKTIINEVIVRGKIPILGTPSFRLDLSSPFFMSSLTLSITLSFLAVLVFSSLFHVFPTTRVMYLGSFIFFSSRVHVMIFVVKP